MKPRLYLKIFTLYTLFGLTNNLSSQSVLNITNQVGNGDYKAQQEVRVKPNNGQVKSTGSGQAHLFIDPSISVPTPYSTSNTFGVPAVTYNLDLSKPFGTIPYTYNVSPLGSAECSIPVEVPIGTNGMRPSLSFVYSSLSGLGDIGNGWSLNGLQSISRVQQTLYHNNNISAVDLTNNDVFALNGNRMFPLVGSNGQSNTTYALEENQFYQITSFNTIGNGPEWFKVETKDGLTLEFGNSPDSRLIPINKNTVYDWKVNKVYDKNGNYILYEYNNSNGECTIKEIKYTGNVAAGLTPYNSIKFYYNLLSEENTFYVNGGELKRKSILRQIDIKQESNHVFQYNFGYSLYMNTSFLTEITLKGSDYSELNKLKLSYQNDTGNPLFQNTTGLSNNFHKQFQFLDFTGDGIKDVISFEGSIVTGQYSPFFWFHWRAMKNNGNATFSQVGTNLNFPDGFSKTDAFPISKNVVGSMVFLSYDFNGDHKEDMLFRSLVGNQDQFAIYLSNGNAGFSQSANINIAVPVVNTSQSNPNNFWIVDINGDQKLDLLHSDNTGSNTYLIRVWLDVANNSNPTHSMTFNNVNIKDARPFDYDGDGKVELLVENTSPTNTFSKLVLNSSSQLILQSIPTSNSYFFNQPNYIITNSGSVYGANTAFLKLDGDFNGDGKTDYIFSSQIGSGPNPASFKWELYFNKGDGSFTAPILMNKSALGLQDHIIAGSGSPKWFYYTSDLNADGKTDLVEFSQNSTSSNTFKVYYSKGVSGDYFSPETYNIPSGFIPFIKEMEFSDIDGNGVNDITMYSQGSSFVTPYVVYFYKGEKSKNIKEIVDGLGRKTEFQFNPITTASIYSENPSNAKIYPLGKFIAPVYVVSEVKISNGIGGTNTDNYLYEDAIIHKKGKGLLGFAKVTRTNSTTNEKQVDEYSNNPTHFNLVKNKTSFFTLFPNTLLMDEVISNINVSSVGLSYWPTISNVLRTNYLQGFTKFTEFGYDANGNTLLERVKFNNTFDVEETFYSSFVSNGSWLPSKPTVVNKFYNRAGKPQFAQTMNYTYDNFGHILSETKEPTDVKKIVINYSYDPSVGVLIAKSESAPNQSLPIHNWQYQYDSRFRLVTNETNALNQTTFTNYDFKWGRPLTKIDIDGTVTNFKYDGYGRLYYVKTPDGNVENIEYSWVTGGDFLGGDPLSVANCFFKLKAKKSGMPEKIEYYDILKRKIRTETDGFNTKTYQMTKYDARGNVVQETNPYQLISSNPFTPVLKTFSYDNLNRLTTISETDGSNNRNTTLTYAYSGGDQSITTVDPSGKVTVKTTDVTGLVKSASDNGGSISYSYYSNRLPENIIVGGNQANYFEYDVYGRRTKFQDRDAGLQLYNFNAYGEIAAKTDAKNQTYNYTYDVIGRLTTKAGPDGNYSYQYITSGGGLNRILQETAPNGYFKKHYYDNIARTTKIEENIAGQTYNTSFVYDQFSRIEKTTYPSGFAIANTFNNKGLLQSIKNDQSNQLIWQCDEVNPFGSVSKYTSGNGIQTFQNYNNYGFPTQFITPGVQNLSFNFNLNTGNLTNKTDNLLSKTESFTFDNLDRLQQVQIASLSNLNVTYNSSGNVINKSGLGVLTYKTNKPDAVNEVDNPNGIISSNQQDITYTSFNQPQNIIEGNYQYDISYGADQERRKSDLYNSSSLVQTRIYVGEYEKTISGLNVEEVHYIQSPSGLAAIFVKNNSNPGVLYFTYSDYLGSILKVTNTSGAVIANLNYDAWGRRRNNLTWDYVTPSLPPSWLYRGYTMHEHLPEFDLINMNGRLYDPVLGQMLSPDPFNQYPEGTQNYNRFAYALNNPLKFSDPDGNIFGTVFGFLRGVYNAVTSGGLEFWNAGKGYVGEAWTKADPTLKGTAGNNGWRIDMGLFKTDNNKKFWGRTWELVSRFTWQLPQTAIGYAYVNIANTIFGRVKGVGYYGGATVVNVTNLPLDFDLASGVTLGSFITGEDISFNPFETDQYGEMTSGAALLRHEYGHYLQSQESGLSYMGKYAISSAAGNSATFTEADADYRSDSYFEKYYGSGVLKLGGYPSGYSPIKTKWWEHAIIIGGSAAGGVPGYIVGSVIVGVINMIK